MEEKGTRSASTPFELKLNEVWKFKIKKDVYVCFFDYTKAFDRVRFDQIIIQLTQLKIYEKDLRGIKNMYCEQTGEM